MSTIHYFMLRRIFEDDALFPRGARRQERGRGCPGGLARPFAASSRRLETDSRSGPFAASIIFPAADSGYATGRPVRSPSTSGPVATSLVSEETLLSQTGFERGKRQWILGA